MMLGWILASWFAFGIINAKWLRKKSKIAQRLNDINWSFLVTLDILVAFIAFSPLYVFKIVTERPYSGETISSFTGRNMVLGKAWAKVLGRAIDGIFLLLANQSQHCLKEAAKNHCLA